MRGSVFKRCRAHGTTGTPARGKKPAKPACKKPTCGSWYWRVDADSSTTLNRKQPTKGGYKTRAAAETALDEYMRQGRVDDDQLTVADWLQRWLSDYGDEWKPTAFDDYRTHVWQVWIPTIGAHRLRDLRRRHIDQALRDMRKPPPVPVAAQATKRETPVWCRDNGGVNDDGTPCKRYANRGALNCPRHGGTTPPKGRANGGRHVEVRSGATLDSYRRTLRSALNTALALELVGSNPAAGQIKAIPAHRKPEAQWWEPEQVGQFLLFVTANQDPDAELYETAAFTGLRRGELGGLAWDDVDLDGETPGISVRQNLVELPGMSPCPYCEPGHQGRLLQPSRAGQVGVKSEASQRWVPLVPATVGVISAHRVRQEERRDKLGSAWQEHGLVYPGPLGEPRRPDGITDRFKRVAALADLPPIKLHEMRHGACALLLAGGMPIEMVSMILGHANTKITRDVYAHILKGPAMAGMQDAVDLVRAFSRVA